MADVATSIDYGTSAKSEVSGKVPVLRMGNLQDSRIDWTDLKYTSDDQEISKYWLEPDTLLFNRTNSPALVGKTSLYRGERPAIFAGYLIRVAFGPRVVPAFANLVMNSDYAGQWCRSAKTDGVSQSNISGSKLAEFALPVPPLAAQHLIVAKVDALMALCDALEARLTTARNLHAQFAAAAVHHLDV
jgi:type I restriction enzyme S subunit